MPSLPNRPARRSLTVLAVLALMAAGLLQAQDQAPFTPAVDEFVTIYLKHGGDKLTNWIQGERTSRPEEARRAFTTIDGLEVDLVASEPVIRQPVDLHFDDRGRLWVVQYLQYPFPAGLSITSYDQYLRARYSGVPAPPPNHVRGADKITVLEDTDGDGRFDTHRDVITGLNIATSVLTGRGGVWVMNPPYLLFYRDSTGDGLPDHDPEVRLAGFGLEDTHSLANSLTWGPDGWLYGVHGSTSTATVRGISFLGQAVWRYHPERDRFELFAQGGGNPWTLSFDSRGRAFSGDNGGNSRGFHWVEGGRYQKNWPKHGPFTKPHSYGYIPHMDHQGDPARFAMTSVVYEDGALPGYEGQLISGMALTSRMQASRFVAAGSTFTTVDSETLVTTSDRSFRPVDTAVGPDGAVYVADWCDIRMDHTDPRDTWDKTCGRIWRLRARDYRPVPRFDLWGKSADDLIELLGDSRKWYRDQARRVLGERRDRSLVPRLRELALEARGQLALEALWTANLISGMDADWALDLLARGDAAVRAWTLRLMHAEPLTPSMQQKLAMLARLEPEAEVRSELARVAGRLDVTHRLAVLQELILRQEDTFDRHVPLRIWWTLEDTITSDADTVLNWLEEASVWRSPLFTEHLAGRIARRFAAERGTLAFTRRDPETDRLAYARHPRTRMPGGKGDYTEWETTYEPEISGRSLSRLARLLEMAPVAVRGRLLEGADEGLAQGEAARQVPERLTALIGKWWAAAPQSGELVAAAARLGYPEAVARVRGSTRASGSDESGRTADDAVRQRGREEFLTHCAPCHQADGSGMARLAPPLRQSKWVLGSDEPLVRIVINGLQGELLMPAMGTLEDQQLADILSYVRRSWGHDAGPIAAETVRRVRAQSAGRQMPWTRDELAESPAR